MVGTAEPNARNANKWLFAANAVTLYIKNPRNVDGFTSNDMIYKFGWLY